MKSIEISYSSFAENARENTEMH